MIWLTEYDRVNFRINKLRKNQEFMIYYYNNCFFPVTRCHDKILNKDIYTGFHLKKSKICPIFYDFLFKEKVKQENLFEPVEPRWYIEGKNKLVLGKSDLHIGHYYLDLNNYCRLFKYSPITTLNESRYLDYNYFYAYEKGYINC